MKKYYVYNGSEQQGPFDIEDLKATGIKRDTLIWFDGLLEWKKAGQLDELKGLLQVSPPPINVPPPVQQVIPVSPSVKKKSYTSLIVTVIIVFIIVAGGAMMVRNNPNTLPGIKLEINTPKPTVITSRADGRKSGLFNARTTVYATVQNQGGDGYVVVTFYVYQGSKTYDKSKSVYLAAGQSEDLEMTFEEVDYISGEIAFSVDTRVE